MGHSDVLDDECTKLNTAYLNKKEKKRSENKTINS